MPKSYYWLLFAVIAWAATFLLVPGRKIRGLLSVGFWGGFVLTVILQLVFEYWLGLYRFNYMLWPIWGFPLMLPFMWFAETIILVNFWPGKTTSRIIYVLGFAAGATLINYFLLRYGFQNFVSWNLYYTFLLAIITHAGIGYLAVDRFEKLQQQR